MTVLDLVQKLQKLDPSLPVRLDVTLRGRRSLQSGAFTRPAGDLKLWSYWNDDMQTTEPCVLLLQDPKLEPERMRSDG